MDLGSGRTRVLEISCRSCAGHCYQLAADFTLSLDDLVISSFVSARASTLPMVIYSRSSSRQPGHQRRSQPDHLRGRRLCIDRPAISCAARISGGRWRCRWQDTDIARVVSRSPEDPAYQRLERRQRLAR